MIHTPTNIALQNGQVYVRANFDEWQYSWPIHTHVGFEVFYFIQGQAHYIIGDEIYEMFPGDMLLFRGDIMHRVNPQNEVRYVRSYVNFMPAMLENFIPSDLYEKLMKLFDNANGLRIRWQPDERKTIEQYFNVMYEEHQKESFGYTYMIYSTLSQLLIHIYRKSKYLVEITPLHVNSTTQMTVQRILQYVNQFYLLNESLDQMAKKLHLSKYYMCHCFKQVTGYTINSYIMSKRIEDAKKLLIEGNMTITEIAEQLSFNTTIHFSRTFKQYVSISPQLFRKSFNQFIGG